MGALLLVTLGATLTLDIVRYHDARHLLDAVRCVKVGTTNGREALRIAQPFHANIYILQHTELPSGFSDHIVDIPATDCIAADCSISFASDAHAPWLTALYSPLLKWPRLRRWIPMSAMFANVTVEQGAVTEVSVEMQSIQQEEVHRARTVLSSKKEAPSWNIKQYTAFISGGLGRTSPTVDTRFNPNKSHPNADAAFDFNINCLLIGRSCSRCEILPRICEDAEHGNWFYFEMPPELLKDFQTAVNRLKLGSTEDSVIKVIGWGGLTSQRLFYEKLPYRFPDGTMVGDHDPERLIYYLKKWREDDNDNPQNQSLTFVFDPQGRLIRIESQVDGIRSRP